VEFLYITSEIKILKNITSLKSFRPEKKLRKKSHTSMGMGGKIYPDNMINYEHLM